VLRGFSGAEKLAYSQDVRACVRDNWSFGLYMTIGCPPDIFYCMGTVLEMAKANFLGTRSAAAFRTSLEAAESYLRRWRWETHGNVCPTNDHSWTLLAEAYRHACLLRLMRWPDTFGRPCEDPAIQASVVAILDACAGLPVTSSFYKRMLFPLFLAGAETSSPHRKHYVDICIDRIKEATGCQHHGMTDILHQVWEERRLNTRGWVNVPWMEFVSLILFPSPTTMRRGLIMLTCTLDLLFAARGPPARLPLLLAFPSRTYWDGTSTLTPTTIRARTTMTLHLPSPSNTCTIKNTNKNTIYPPASAAITHYSDVLYNTHVL
jgi:hypothetical protein